MLLPNVSKCTLTLFYSLVKISGLSQINMAVIGWQRDRSLDALINSLKGGVWGVPIGAPTILEDDQTYWIRRPEPGGDRSS
jgi:hypothetical protein